MKRFSLLHGVIIIAIIFAFFGSFASGYSMHLKYGGIDKVFEQYLQDKKDMSDNWMTFMTILSTVFAVFFVYSGFKIDKDLRDIQEKGYAFLDKLEIKYEEKIKQIEKKVNEEKEELNARNEQEKEELRNENFFLKEIQFFDDQINNKGLYDESIEGLNLLLKNDSIRNDNEKYNKVIILVSKSYYGKWLSNDNLEDLSQALIFAKEAIEDASDPYVTKLVSLFNEHGKNGKNS